MWRSPLDRPPRRGREPAAAMCVLGHQPSLSNDPSELTAGFWCCSTPGLQSLAAVSDHGVSGDEEAASEHSQTTVAAISSGRPIRSIGSWAMTLSRGRTRTTRAFTTWSASSPPVATSSAVAGLPQCPHPRHRHQALPPSRRRRPHPRLRKLRPQSRTRAQHDHLRRRTRITHCPRARPARLLGRHPTAQPGPGAVIRSLHGQIDCDQHDRGVDRAP
jgi:hypothetical protein